MLAVLYSAPDGGNMCHVQNLQGVWCSDRDFFKEQEVVQGVRILLHICNENLQSEGFDIVDTCSMAMAKSHGRCPARMALECAGSCLEARGTGP